MPCHALESQPMFSGNSPGWWHSLELEIVDAVMLRQHVAKLKPFHFIYVIFWTDHLSQMV